MGRSSSRSLDPDTAPPDGQGHFPGLDHNQDDFLEHRDGVDLTQKDAGAEVCPVEVNALQDRLAVVSDIPALLQSKRWLGRDEQRID